MVPVVICAALLATATSSSQGRQTKTSVARGRKPPRGTVMLCGDTNSAAGAQDTLEDLAGRAHRQRIGELHAPRRLVDGHLLAAPGDDLVFGRRLVRLADDERLDVL